MGKCRDSLDSLLVGSSFAFRADWLVIVKAEIKAMTGRVFVIRKNTANLKDGEWRVWRAE